MILNLTSKGFKLTTKTYQYIQKNSEKLIRRLPDISPDLSQLSLLIRKHSSIYMPKRHHNHAYTNFTNRKGSFALFEGSVNLNLPVKKLHAQFKGKSIEECLHIGMERIQKELNKYKDLHFKSRSKYANHKSIRIR